MSKKKKPSDQPERPTSQAQPSEARYEVGNMTLGEAVDQIAEALELLESSHEREVAVDAACRIVGVRRA